MVDSPIVRGRGRTRKIKSQTIKRDLEVNDLSLDLISYRKLWCVLIHTDDPTQ